MPTRKRRRRKRAEPFESRVAQLHRRPDLPYVYLGYWVEGSDRMAYKASFRPMERLGRDGWRRMDAPEMLPEPLIADQLPTRSPKRILIDA
jgi:arginine-tRNA-protein transferase